MTARRIETLLLSLEIEAENPFAETIATATSFEDAGILTRNRGVVLHMRDGSVFQITIVQSAPSGLVEADEEGQ